YATPAGAGAQSSDPSQLEEVKIGLGADFAPLTKHGTRPAEEQESGSNNLLIHLLIACILTRAFVLIMVKKR
ncbi:hypothetical protein, partial [Pelagicoccus sp. SDUM812005]|uniref:hypothetical protein n=1 Tax=Pelagicoccus sp. SDUM812005 TaxID=3041257 RepID=UPI00280C59C2